jgi:glycyl-tRNA synthetase beta chain
MSRDRPEARASRSQDLLLEVGTEEIPAKFQARALAELPAQVTAKLAAARLVHGDVAVHGTPRRIAVIVRALADRQPDLRERVFGPPASAAFGPDGKPTKAALGFAHKNGVDPAALEQAEQPGKKGRYVVADRFVKGQATAELLPALLAELIAGIAWPKSMRWSWGETAFVRPVQWLVALYGTDIVPVTFAGQSAGRASRGHRFLSRGAIEIKNAAAYVEALRKGFVIVDPAARKDVIRAELLRIEKDTRLTVRPDAALLDEVTHLAEYPVGIAGGFDPSYLEVPEEVIVTAMRTHQRYFAMSDANGKLAPRFVTIAGTVVKDADVVRKGNERVIASRLADAKFFFAEDQKKPLAEHGKKLDGVVFQAKLGDKAKTIGDKVRRIERIVEGFAGANIHCDAAALREAARLCKADLATGVVGEFPELQGVMGKHYARRAGLAETVALAIEEHYWPKGQGAPLPATAEGALVGLADRIDTLVGCFATGLQPSGSADPLGLRRAAIGVLAILLDRGPGGAHETAGWPTGFTTLITLAKNAYDGKLAITDDTVTSLLDFFRGRLRALLVDAGLAAQDVEVVLGVDYGNPCDARARARDVAVVPPAAREVFKRIANILDDAKQKGEAFDVPDPKRFVSPAETRLWDAFSQRSGRIHNAIATRKYRDSFQLLADLAPDIAAFFDKGGVMVMDPDPALRRNRLSVLSAIHSPFATIADFRLLAAAERAS